MTENLLEKLSVLKDALQSMSEQHHKLIDLTTIKAISSDADDHAALWAAINALNLKMAVVNQQIASLFSADQQTWSTLTTLVNLVTTIAEQVLNLQERLSVVERKLNLK